MARAFCSSAHAKLVAVYTLSHQLFKALNRLLAIYGNLSSNQTGLTSFYRCTQSCVIDYRLVAIGFGPVGQTTPGEALTCHNSPR